MMSLENLKKYGIQVDSFSYRGVDVSFYEDALGHQITAIWKDNIVQFGVYNTSYRDDMQMIIDDHLDTITRFEDNPFFHGAKLEYFQNAQFWDVRLSYRGRILKIYLTPTSEDLKEIEEDARGILTKEIQKRSF